MKNKKCLDCNRSISKLHPNSKRCKDCALIVRLKPISNLTEKQKELARKFAGKMYPKDLVKKIRCSRSSLIRFGRDEKISFNFHSYKPDIVKRVSAYYQNHTKRETEKKFPHVSVRSIVERHKLHRPKQRKWQAHELLYLLRYSGIATSTELKNKLNRPNAHEGSIRSVFVKNLKTYPGLINGLYRDKAKYFCDVKKTPFYNVKYGESRRAKRKLYLWQDIRKNIYKDHNKVMIKFLDAMVLFQKWIWKGLNINESIGKY